MTDESADSPPPKLKLQRPRQAKESAGDSNPQLTPPPKAEETVTPKPLPKLVPKEPIAQDSIKANEISTPASPEPIESPQSTPPPLNAPAPKPQQELAPGLQNRLDERAPAGTEELLQKSLKAASTPTPEAPKNRSSIGTSIALIIDLMLILGGGGYTIWEMFMQPETGSASPEKPSLESAAEPKNPIERAEATIAEVPTLDMEALTNETEADAAPSADDIALASSDSETPPAAELQTGDLRTSVSGFLSSATIGMVRTGSSARVMLNSENFRIGDVVDPATGLVFQGTQDGKLVFKDRNEVTYHKSF